MFFKLVICGGIHPLNWTNSFLKNINFESLNIKKEDILIIDNNLSSAYDGKNIYQNLVNNYGQKYQTPLIFIGFSAGVVGALIASRLWQRYGGKILALIAVDGWGVPLIADFPIYTLSHDYFTHLTLIKFDHQIDSFYSYPSVSHEQIWRSPSETKGYWQKSNGIKILSNATTIIKFFLEKYQQM